jgi:hypothetical protein
MTFYLGVGQGLNKGPTLRQGPTLRKILAWAMVRTKGQLFGIYSRRPRAYLAVFTGWAKVRIRCQLCSTVFTRCGIYSRGPRFEPKKGPTLRNLFTRAEVRTYGLHCKNYLCGPRFELMAYRTLQYLLALLT